MRRTSLLKPSFLLAGMTATAVCPLGVFADGTEVLGKPSIAIESGTGVAHAGTGLASGSGKIKVYVPQGVTIEQVLLYWAGRGLGGETIVIQNQVVTGLSIGGDGDPSQSYRADITHLNLVKPGKNTLSLQAPGFAAVDDGAGVLVIFDDGTGRLSGRAFAVQANVAGVVNTTLVDTGNLPASGGKREEHLLTAQVPGVLNLGVLNASTMGANNQSSSRASTADLDLNVAGLIGVSAKVLESKATAQCTAYGPTATGDSEIVDLKINGLNVNVSGDPNQTLMVDGVKVVINEQVMDDIGRITVNALHVTANLFGKPLTDVVVSSAHADVDCGVTVATKMLLKDGNDFAFFRSAEPFKTTKARTFTFAPASHKRIAKLRLFVADAVASRPDIIKITVGGKTRIIADRLASTDGSQWDSPTIPVTIPAGVSKVTVQLLSQKAASSKLTGSPDSLAWVMAHLTVPGERRNLFSGRATVVQANALGLVNATLVDTGPLPSEGGSLMEKAIDANVLNLVQAEVLSASTVGGGKQSNSKAAVAKVKVGLSVTDELPLVGKLPVVKKTSDLNLPVLTGDLGSLVGTVPVVSDLPLVGQLLGSLPIVGDLLSKPLKLSDVVGEHGISLTAKVIDAKTKAECTARGAIVSGNSRIVALVLNVGGLNLDLDITGEPNQTIDVLGLIKIIINEQAKSIDGHSGDITVNALHVIASDALKLVDAADLVDVVVSSSHSDISCSPSAKYPH